MMKKLLISLAAIAIAAGLLLGLSLGLSGLAQKNEAAVLQATMKSMLPGSTSFTEEAYDGEDEAILQAWKGQTGFIVKTRTQGYAGPITMLVGVSNEGKAVGLLVLDMEETLGLGGNALTDWQFLANFLNTEGDAAIGSGIDAITGATVTSKAVARCVNSAVAYVTGADVGSSATSWGG